MKSKAEEKENQGKAVASATRLVVNRQASCPGGALRCGCAAAGTNGQLLLLPQNGLQHLISADYEFLGQLLPGRWRHNQASIAQCNAFEFTYTQVYVTLLRQEILVQHEHDERATKQRPAPNAAHCGSCHFLSCACLPPMAEQHIAIWPTAYLRRRAIEAKAGCVLILLDVTSFAAVAAVAAFILDDQNRQQLVDVSGK